MKRMVWLVVLFSCFFVSLSQAAPNSTADDIIYDCALDGGEIVVIDGVSYCCWDDYCEGEPEDIALLSKAAKNSTADDIIYDCALDGGEIVVIDGVSYCCWDDYCEGEPEDVELELRDKLQDLLLRPQLLKITDHN